MAGTKRSSSSDAEGRKKKVKKNAVVQEQVEDLKLAEQAYCIVPSEKRFGLLCTFLKKNLQKKIVVIFGSSRTLQFHKEIFRALGIICMNISEKQAEQTRTTVLGDFIGSEKGVLLCTNVVASGFDGLAVDWIVQFEPPQSGEAFLQQISRNGSSKGLVLLLPAELEFLSFLKKFKVPLTECDFRDIKIANVQSQMQKLVEKQFLLHQLSHDAYRAYIVNYSKHPMNKAFNITKLNVQAAAVSFGIKCPPKVI